jgi:uncharacterized membrane protein
MARTQMAIEVRLRETDRLEFFSDGVIAIAATLLVADLRPPRVDMLSGTSLVAALSREWPSFFAFGLSFIFIGIAWAAHHDMFNYIQRTNHVLLIINLFFLLGIALQPFSTALLAEHIDKPTARTAALVYYGILLETSIAYNAIWWYAVSSGLVPAESDRHLIRALSREHAAGPLFHTAAMATALWSVPLSFIPLGILYVFFALPRVSERWNPEKHSSGT